jgi:cytoskeletal protein CcmA (bactofilin family)
LSASCLCGESTRLIIQAQSNHRKFLFLRGGYFFTLSLLSLTESEFLRDFKEFRMKIKDGLKLSAVVILFIGLFSTAQVFAGGDDAGEVKGTIQSLPASGLVGDWRVANRTIHVTVTTRVDQEHGAAGVGASVEVKGTPQSDGSLNATSIEVKSGTDGSSGGGGSDDSAPMDFKGTIETFPSGLIGDWRVGGRILHVTAATRIQQELGPVAVGAFVEVKGSVQTDGSMNATKIEVKSNVAGNDGRDELKGAIESLPNTTGFTGDWRVGGRTVHVTTFTVIDREHGAVLVGASVEIKGIARTDGSIDATKIEVNPGSSSDSGSTGEDAGFKGAIESLPGGNLLGDWVISGRTVHVTSTSQLKSEHGAFGVGVRVKVKGTLRTDGSVDARKIQVRDSF